MATYFVTCRWRAPSLLSVWGSTGVFKCALQAYNTHGLLGLGVETLVRDESDG